VARDKDRTKTGEDRIVELCPRALEVLNRQLVLRERLEKAGTVRHRNLFFKDNGAPIRYLNDPYDRWRWTLDHTSRARYRDPYNARHSCVSWNLMIGKNLLWAAKQHGHSVQTMLTMYAAWTEGATDADIEAIRRAMRERPAELNQLNQEMRGPLESPKAGTGLALASRRNSVSKRMRWEMYGGKGGTRTLDPGIMSAVL